MRKSIGRGANCDIIILDPKNRVSREHAVLIVDHGKVYIEDNESANGTYINGHKIQPHKPVNISPKDSVSLSKDVTLDLAYLLNQHFNFGNTKHEQTLVLNNPQITLTKRKQTVTFDPEKTTIADLTELDGTPFKTVGRGLQNDFQIHHNNVSSKHLKIRILSPEIVEVIDLESTNGTYADGKKLEPNKSYRFINSVQLYLSNTYPLDLKELFPSINIVTKNRAQSPSIKTNSPTSPNAPITTEELTLFNELEYVWREYAERQQKAGQISNTYGLVGTAIGLAFSVATGGVGGVVVAGGMGLAGRYFGQQKSNEIRGDLTMEDMFLQTYACPRCKESFQKKPWVTIKDCFKCKLKFK